MNFTKQDVYYYTILILSCLVFTLMLVIPADGYLIYNQTEFGDTLTSSPIIISQYHNSVFKISFDIYPLMVSGTKLVYDTTDGVKSFSYYRPYEFSNFHVDVYKNDKLIYTDTYYGFTSNVNKYDIAIYDTGVFKLNLTGRFAKFKIR